MNSESVDTQNYDTIREVTATDNNEKIYNNSEKSIDMEMNNSEKSENLIIKPDKPLQRYKCRICDRLYSNVKSRWSHERVCNKFLDKHEPPHELRQDKIKNIEEQAITQPKEQPQENKLKNRYSHIKFF